MSEKSFEVIANQIYVEKQPITYKWLSRTLQISNSNAQQLLERYFDEFRAEKKDLASKYVITGKSGDATVVKMTTFDELEASKKELDTIFSCSIYSLNLDAGLSLDNIVAVNRTIDMEYTPEKMAKWGVIATNTAVRISTEVKREKTLSEQPSARPAQRNAVSEPVTKNKTVKSEPVTKSLYVSRKQQPVAEPKKVEPKKVEPKKMEPKKKEPKKPVYTSRKAEVKNKVVYDKGAEETEVETVEPPKKKNKVETQEEKEQRERRQGELAKMFEDDEDDFKFSDEEEHDQRGSIDVEEIPEESGKTESTEPADEPVEEPVEEPVAEPEQESTTDEPKVESFYDEDGYLVTKVKETPEPARPTKRNNTHPPTKKRTIEVNNKKPAAKSGKKQASLMSFFGKRK